jgi:hypothetical protein
VVVTSPLSLSSLSSLQNWQSQFVAVFALVVLGIFLRERGSPESKPVAAAHADTGSA